MGERANEEATKKEERIPLLDWIYFNIQFNGRGLLSHFNKDLTTVVVIQWANKLYVKWMRNIVIISVLSNHYSKSTDLVLIKVDRICKSYAWHKWLELSTPMNLFVALGSFQLIIITFLIFSTIVSSTITNGLATHYESTTKSRYWLYEQH